MGHPAELYFEVEFLNHDLTFDLHIDFQQNLSKNRIWLIDNQSLLYEGIAEKMRQ